MSIHRPGSSASFDSEKALFAEIPDIISRQTRLNDETLRRERERYVDHSGRTFVHYAAKEWNDIRVEPRFGPRRWSDIRDKAWSQVLEDCGEKVKWADRDGRTALSLAAEAGNIVAIRLLLSHDPGLFHDDMDTKRRTPLFYLLQHRKKIRQKFDNDPVGYCFGFTEPSKPDALVGHLIWNLGDFEARGFKRDTKYKIPLPPTYVSSETLSQTDGEGRTLLSRAVELRDYGFVRILLLVEKIDIKQADLYGEAPLLRAIKNQDSVMARLLATRDPGAFKSLMQTLGEQGDDALIKLVQMAWDIKFLNHEESGENALRCALELEKISVIALLLEYGVQPRPIERRTDWFALPDVKTKAFIELAERRKSPPDERGTKVYTLSFVDIAKADVLRSMR